ncbi:conjugal transfer protein TraF [Simiduia curdlanivorans]|uniref:Conjugal transfer protein TraF n=1 Tax=Simiduia curdlanivorans TaxID=1492769 RepID=A0ABV8V2I3_9GAMM|nr:conjugal transfer protein TraF [Simiduia curdlanivorans]MDN3637711.1 conjugal transfer protein TraF [Simiduia curdlanivorans]
MLRHIPRQRLAAALALTICAPSTLAANGFMQTGPAGTYGKASSGQTAISNSGNPAAIGFDRQRMNQENTVLGALYLGGELEYGNIQELFDIYDELANAFNDDGSSSGGGSGGGSTSGGGLDFGDIDINDPDIAAIIDRVEGQANHIGALLALVATEGYANADAAVDLPLIFNTDIFGGTLGFNFSYSGSASAVGFMEDIDFDAATAQTELEAAFNLQPGDPATTYDLSGGISLTIDPNTNSVSGTFDNDSLLATRAAQATQFGVSYSYPIVFENSSTLYLGATAKYVRMGLARVATRIGDITDSEDLFDDIRDAKFVNTNRFGMDFGALWVAKHVSLGTSITDAFEPSYEFNAIDTSNYNNPTLGALIDELQTYEQERQITVEGSLYTEDRAWALSTSYETAAIKDPLGAEHQWFSISGGWNSNSFWVPSVRLGYHMNQVGSEINMYKLGFTLFRYVDLDLGMSSEKVEIDGTSLPQGASANLGFHYTF